MDTKKHTMRSIKKIRGVLSTLLILGLVLFPSTAKAAERSTDTFPDPIYTGSVNGIDRMAEPEVETSSVETSTVETPSPLPTEEPPYTILKTYTGFVDGVERTLHLIKNDWLEIAAVIEIGTWASNYAYRDFDLVTAGLDKYGCVQVLTKDNMVYWWSYDLSPNLSNRGCIVVPNTLEPNGYLTDIESFVFEGTGSAAVIVGYKSLSGQTYPLPSFERMKKIGGFDSPLEPQYVPKELSTPSASRMPTQTPTLATPIPTIATDLSVAEPTIPQNKKLSIKKSKKKGVTTYSLCEGNKAVIEYSLKKGKLNWKAGKKKLLIKKGAKKPVYSGRFGIKVKRASGRPLNISNK